MQIFFYTLVGILAFVLIRNIFWPAGASTTSGVKKHGKLKKRPGRESWVQVYDTDSVEEAQSLQARLEEEELECLVYEQGRKDVHGNELKGFGIAVPRTSVPRAQSIIVRMPS